MLVELAERLGPSLAHWIDAPFAFALWTHKQLQQLDYGRLWRDRMHRLELADLMHLAFNDPRRLGDERARVVAMATRRFTLEDDITLRERGERMARFIRKGEVLVS